jgi:DNA-binding XRE family transcriptional regulator
MTGQGDTASGVSKAGLDHLQARFRKILRASHRIAGPTQSTLADMAGSTQQYVAKIEAGQINPTLATMVSVAEVLNPDVGDMLRPTLRRNRWHVRE